MTITPRGLTASLAAVLLALAALTLPAQAPGTTLTGKWIGTFDVVNPDGSVDPGNAFFNLTQSGNTLSGKAGEASDHLSPIASGTIDGEKVAFTVAVNAEMVVNIDLVRTGDRLQGTASGLPVGPGAKIEVIAVRADDAWHTPQPIAHAPDRLFEVVANLDRQLFDAYNTCDLKTLSALVSEDLEFYHDKTGLAVGRTPFIDSIKNNICGKTQRTLTPGSLEVHRLTHYGAVEIGLHTFSHPGIDTDQGKAKFISIWRFKDGSWQLTRVISYDHEPLTP